MWPVVINKYLLMKRIVVLFSFILLCSTVFSQHHDLKDGIKFVEGKSWEKILKISEKTKKLIFLDCFTSWCGPCKGLAKDIFTQKKVGDFFNANFINIHYDMEKGEGKMLYKKYKKYIIGFPTLLLIDHTGTVLHQMAGYQKADALIQGMKDGLEGKSLFALREKYENGQKDLEFLKKYVVALKGAFLKDELSKVIKDYMGSVPLEKIKEKEVWDFVKDEINDPYSKEFKFVFDNLDYYQRKLNIDRYEIERQLEWKLSIAVKDIVNSSEKNLKACSEKQQVLLSMLKDRVLKNSDEKIAMLVMHNYKLESNVPKVFELLCNSLEFGMFKYKPIFFTETVRFLVTNTNDKNILETCYKWIYDLQTVKSNPILMTNHYDILALIYEKQGNTDKAKEAKNKYEDIEEAKRKKYEKYFNKNK